VATKRKPDNCEFVSDGQVRLTFGGVSRTLRRPTIGQLKRLNNSLMDLAKTQTAPANPVDVDVDEVMNGTLAWWAEVIDDLRLEDDLPAPADRDDFPSWMMNGELMVKIQSHWREVPWDSGRS
jgi:hypothetical protein